MKIGNRVQRKVSKMLIGSLDINPANLGFATPKIQQGIAGRIITELFVVVRHSARITYGTAPTFRHNNGVLQQMVKKMKIKLDTDDYLIDCSPIGLKYVDFLAKKSIQHCGSVAGAAALADNVQVAADNNCLVVPTSTQILTADEMFSIDFADSKPDFAEGVLSALDTRDKTNLFVEFEAQEAAEYFATAGDATVDQLRLKIDVYAMVIDDLLPSDKVQYIKNRITEQDIEIRSSGAIEPVDLARDGKNRALHILCRNGNAGAPFSSSVVSRIRHRKNKEKDVILDADFHTTKAMSENMLELYDPYVAGEKITVGMATVHSIVSHLDEATDNSKLSNGVTPTVNNELELTGSTAATYTAPVKVKVIEETFLDYEPKIKTA